MPLGASHVALLDRGYDTASRIASLPDSLLIGRILAPVWRFLVAAPRYLARYGRPTYPLQLLVHRCIACISAPGETWHFTAAGGDAVVVRPVSLFWRFSPISFITSCRRGGFLGEADRRALIALVRDGSSLERVTRRANALVLLDDGLSCQEVARVLLFDDDTIRGWYELFEQGGLESLTRFDMGGSASNMSAGQAEALKIWIPATPPIFGVNRVIVPRAFPAQIVVLKQ